MKQSRSRVLAIGPLPPPVNGFTWVTERFAAALAAASADLVVIRTTPALPANAATLRRRGARIAVIAAAYARALAALLGRRRGTPRPTVYLPISGGIGKLIELPFVLLARATGARLVIHHHSFAYLNWPSRLSRAFLRCGGRAALHISLGPAMSRLLREVYGIARIEEISNACFIDPPSAPPAASSEALRIAYFGNISEAKGILSFMDVCRQLAASGVGFSGHVAGPFESEAVRRQVEPLLRDLPQVKLWGPVYGGQKAEFFRSIDVLLFPSRYRNEAEPVTILEALAQSVPVMATELGCVGDLLAYSRDEWLLPEPGFAKLACSRLARYAERPEALAAARLAARARFEHLRESSSARLHGLIGSMTGEGR
jgi:glycosyltransferase involved in cell wall biosynthesis